MATYEITWQLKPRLLAKKHSGKLVQARLTFNGWNAMNYFTWQEAMPDAERFESVEEFSVADDDQGRGAGIIVQKFLQLKALLEDKAVEVLPESPVPVVPANVFPFHVKTRAERRLDEAMLQVELASQTNQSGPLDRARAILDQMGDEAHNPFGWSVARRIEVMRAFLVAGTDEQARTLRRELEWKACADAQKVIQALEDEELSLFGGFRHYWFGENYRPDGMLAAAALTAGCYRLEHEADPEAALRFAEIGEKSNHGFAELHELKVRALLQLGREEEAFAEHYLRRSCQLEEVLNSPRYQAYVKSQDEAKAGEAARKVAAVRWLTHKGPPLSPSELGELAGHCGALPESLSLWLGRGKVSGIERVSEGYSTHYRRLDPAGILEAQAEMLRWIHLHDESSPIYAAELHQSMRDQGHDPKKMLPVVREDEQPEFFVIKLDEPDCGAVFLWSHEESSNFDRVADSAQGLWSYIRS